MATNLIPHDAGGAITYRDAPGLPAIIMDAGEQASKRFIEFFTANIRNPNTSSTVPCSSRTTSTKPNRAAPSKPSTSTHCADAFSGTAETFTRTAPRSPS